MGMCCDLGVSFSVVSAFPLISSLFVIPVVFLRNCTTSFDPARGLNFCE